ncbi:MAG TPA: Replication factor C small subunit, partial [Candidatus Nanoarchaeia archaeon]|nr:Replication factor C small subunit [Candidatus Nanoarchaeia archaeon]
EARKLMLKVMYDNGLSGLDMIKFLQRELLNLKIPPKQQMELYIACAEAEFRLVEGSDEFIQLEAFLAKVGVINSK